MARQQQIKGAVSAVELVPAPPANVVLPVLDLRIEVHTAPAGWVIAWSPRHGAVFESNANHRDLSRGLLRFLRWRRAILQQSKRARSVGADGVRLVHAGVVLCALATSDQIATAPRVPHQSNGPIALAPYQDEPPPPAPKRAGPRSQPKRPRARQRKAP